ncbi:hypothetical protein E4T43_03797 [Aureobasidium subglaciale]|nr:hypothetical protein E4T43_03797 [Aureobasidium subglaciale]
MDGHGTINPAALNSTLDNSPYNNRGLKRSRSPLDPVDTDDFKPRKRGRPPKQKTADSPQMASHPAHLSSPLAVQTPQIKQGGNQSSPSQASPQRNTPASGQKTTVVKALPTVRDHTTDQLGPEGDEYIPREIDEAGEKKVDANGNLTDREYRIRIFTVPNRGQKMFMLATECARALGYRDSYLLFNKNRSLYKIIANQPEKDNLIHQEILPYSYRSRQIAIVTARSMFRQFGSRVVTNGRRVRDDYWESKARSQGFTEEDAAGEKRPGAAKQREAAAAEASTNTTTLTSMPHTDIIYTNGPGLEGHPAVPPGIHPVTLAPLSMINMPSDDPRVPDFRAIARPRQELTGPAYQDRTQPSNPQDIFNQANQAAEFNKSLTQQRVVRNQYYEDYWKRPHEPPTPPPQPHMPDTTDMGAIAPHTMQSPQSRLPSISQPSMMAHQQAAAHMMPSQFHQQNQQNPMQSPVRSMHQQLPSSQMHQNSPAAMGMSSMRQQTPSYGYQQGQMWPPSQPQPSPLSQAHNMAQFQQQPQQSPMHPPSQMGAMAGYSTMNPMGPAGAFAGMNRNMYQPSPSPQQFAMQQQQQGTPASSQQQNMHGWAPPSTNPASMTPQDWQRYQ